ncbi:hypothetical protein Sinac_6271 [Singulisphaera acidiphila DSM 18658]|uniref:Uncharacterized protein n=1 Tax=Singulisphaera acidiphila (strain ATCC BAA-1392 / DSM 18658 / VKM B-2454 / MOB10) TaxID=886293 RepID=L0DNG2_SINAD|nr:hypothetical protein Sinac_6271 [Singulisphaera acidiphila DSM 18658]
MLGRRMVLNLTRSFCGKEEAASTNHLLATLSSILIGASAGWGRLHERGGFTPLADSGVQGEWIDLCRLDCTRCTRDFLLHA